MTINVSVPLGSVLESVLRCDTPDSQAGENVLHYVVSAITGTGARLQQTADAIAAAFAPVYKALIFNGANFTGAYVTIVGPGARSITLSGLASGGSGTAGAGVLPEQCSGLLTKLTLTGGRKGRGRIYVPFPSSADLATTGLPVAGYLSRLTAFGTVLVGAVTVTDGSNTSTLSPCIVPRARPVPLASTSPVLDYVLRFGFATQRRRSFYGRRNPLA